MRHSLSGRYRRRRLTLMPIALVGTLDTKGMECQFVRDHFRGQDVEAVVIDTGVGTPSFQPEIDNQRIFAAAGTTLSEIRRVSDRGRAVEAAARGAAVVVRELYDAGKIDGIISLGGSAGTTIGTSAMRALPFGIPKLMVSTMASGQVRQWVGVRDIFMLHSVVDICGLNRISKQVLTNAANAMIGMVGAAYRPNTAADDRPLVAATMFGVTTPCVDACRRQL